MSYTILEKKQSFGVNKAFIKQKIARDDFDKFTKTLNTYLVALRHAQTNNESEEHQKALLKEFLQSAIGKDHYINTKDRIDLAIYGASTGHSPVNVIIEVKSLNNKNEMLTKTDINRKALHEALLYYARERISENNIELKKIIITNGLEWFIFDARLFEKLFYENKQFIKAYKDFKNKHLTNTDTNFFYNEIAKAFIGNIRPEDFIFAYINLSDYKITDIEIVKRMYRLFSKEHLLKLNFANDSNSLNKSFYDELLYIIGLTEKKEGSKKVIVRHKKNEGSFLEATIEQLQAKDILSYINKPNDYGQTREDRLFNIALELNITWLNRILFLKLLEGQLVSYHPKANKDDYCFLNMKKFPSFDALDGLFFQILARQPQDRNSKLADFNYIPYLNSSLFETTALEREAVYISNLNDTIELPLYSSTVLKDSTGKRLKGKMNSLQYMYRFLDSYNFASEGSDEIQEDNKSLINASVLGLIFEKINGYKEGSFFTPSFITMYMSHQTIRKAVVQKFNNHYGWQITDFNALYNKIDDKQQANRLIDSLTICDPAVGSGHFLVSALNEIIAIKSELKILMDNDGKILRDYDIEVSNDELIITIDGELFSYNPKNKESQRVQQTLFHQKQTIIENCLFGVDINPNSVNICRLRLWIELLKHAYYKNETELETLPNIDINIKCGNSLISRFGVDQKIGNALKKAGHSIQSYKNAVYTYKNATSKQEKHQVNQVINDVKNSFTSYLESTSPLRAKEIKSLGLIQNYTSEINLREARMFELTKAQKAKLKGFTEKLLREQANLEKIQTEIAQQKSNIIYDNAFEWRFEFPEILDDEGNFIGFDAIIGNPPYMIIFDEREKKYLEQKFPEFKRNNDLYVAFFGLTKYLLTMNGITNLITPNTFLRGNYFIALRKFILSEFRIIQIRDFGQFKVFEDANVYCAITETILKNDTTAYSWNLLDKDKNILGKINSKTIDFFVKNTLIEKLDKFNKIGINKESFLVKDVGFNYWTKGRKKIRGGSIGSRVLYEGEKKNTFDIPYLKGRDIDRYSISKPHNYLLYNWDKLLNPEDTFRFSKDIMNISPKIIYRQTASKIVATIDTGSNFIDKTVHIIIPTEESEFSLYCLLGIINSKLINYYLTYYKNEQGRNFAQIKTIDIKNLPLPFDIGKQDIYKLETKVKQRLNNDENSQNIEDEIDLLVYKLYNLTYDEILTIDPTTAITEEEYGRTI